MGIHTFIYPSEVEKCSHVSDKELDKLYQEVKLLSNNRLLLQEEAVIIKRFMRKPSTKILYTLYYYSGNLDAQIINFAQDHEWSINTSVTASYIYTYLYGYLYGYYWGHSTQLHNNQTGNKINDPINNSNS